MFIPAFLPAIDNGREGPGPPATCFLLVQRVPASIIHVPETPAISSKCA
jgi:hypothetical protein